MWHDSHYDLLRENPKKLLYGSYIPTKRVSIWYAWHNQLVQKITIQKPIVTLAKVYSKTDTIVDECLEWNGSNWTSHVGNEADYRYALYLNEKEHGNVTISRQVHRFASNPAHEYPFAITTQKADTDKFFELLFNEDARSFTHANDRTEVPQSPLLLVEEDNIEHLAKILLGYATLINNISRSGFPPHLQFSSDTNDYKFTLSALDDKLPFNIVSDGRNVLVSVIDDENKAAKYLEDLKHSTHKDVSNEHEFPFHVAVLTMDIEGEGDSDYKFEPLLKTDITSGDAVEDYKNRTEGGR